MSKWFLVKLLCPFFSIHFMQTIFPISHDPALVNIDLIINICLILSFTLGLLALTRKLERSKGIFYDLLCQLPFEIHIPGHNFTGPGTDLSKRLTSTLTFWEDSKPVNLVDQAAFRHDVGYLMSNDSCMRESLDLELLDDMENIMETEEATAKEKMEAFIVNIVMTARCVLRRL